MIVQLTKEFSLLVAHAHCSGWTKNRESLTWKKDERIFHMEVTPDFVFVTWTPEQDIQNFEQLIEWIKG